MGASGDPGLPGRNGKQVSWFFFVIELFCHHRFVDDVEFYMYKIYLQSIYTFL